MTLPEFERVNGYTCYLSNRGFANEVAIVDGSLRMHYRCENDKTGAVHSFDVRVPVNNEMILDIRSKIVRELELV